MKVSTWAERLPQAWRVLPLKYVADISNSNVDKKTYEDGIPVHLCNYTDVYYNDYITSTMEMMRATATASEVRRFSLRRGDVIITKDSESWTDIGVPACVADELSDVICGYHLTMMRPWPNVIYGPFLLRCLQASGIREQLWTAANGVTRYGLGQQGIRDALVPIPPVEIQRSIANFLDRKVAAVDVLIEKRERLISLLAEKQAALIHRAVTKGLNPDAPKKDSGIPWIGEIPAHWACAPLYSRYETQLGKMLDTQRIVGGELRPYVRNADIQWSGVNTENLHQMDFSPAERMHYRLRPGDLLVCEGGANEKIVGRSAIWVGHLDECYFQKALHRVRPTLKGENPRFLLYALRAAVNLGVFVAGANPNTVFHLTGEKLRAHRFAFPPANEQNDIVREVENQLRALDTLDGHVRRQLDRLQEYRQALITAAVTGQLDIGELSQ
jgi:type I restriction enzyme S subunit